MINVLVTGGEGQLASNLKDICDAYPPLNLIFKEYTELDVTNTSQVKSVFESTTFNYCINCAAYTAVDKAEDESEIAFKVNEQGSKNLAKFCSDNNVTLIHISTDFVFEGNTSKAYTETDATNPQGNYGLSKLKGELAIQQSIKKYFIIRTSWLYSEHNKNFMKTMIQLSASRDELRVVDDQIGTPTYAKDLAHIILKIIDSKDEVYGIYNFSNEGVASWYDFANAIFQEINSNIKLLPTKTKDFPAPAKRPSFSVLDKTKIKDTLGIEIPHWRASLKEAIINFKTKTV